MPSSQQVANTVAYVEVAGAYVRKAAYRRSESDFSPLSIGGRKSREAGLQPQVAKSVTAWLITAAQDRFNTHGGQRTAS